MPSSSGSPLSRNLPQSIAISRRHNAVLEWLSNLFDSSVGDGRLGVSVSRLQGTSPIALQMALQNKLVELRSTYASIPDQLSGRMPLAYVQLVQILTDLLIFCTPFALVHSVGGFGAVLGALARADLQALPPCRSLVTRSAVSQERLS